MPQNSSMNPVTPPSSSSRKTAVRTARCASSSNIVRLPALLRDFRPYPRFRDSCEVWRPLCHTPYFVEHDAVEDRLLDHGRHRQFPVLRAALENADYELRQRDLE